MLIEFSVKNFRSIKELQTLSLVAAPLRSRNQDIDKSNTIHFSDELKFLKSVAIYGANGSGKSNMILSMIHMLVITRDLMKDEKLLETSYDPFALNEETINKPTYFQIQFILNGKKYRYGFEFNRERIVSEWLFGPAETKEVYYFKRNLDDIQINVNQFKEGRDLADKTIPQNLFLNVVRAFNGAVSKEIKEYLSESIAISGGVTDIELRRITLEMMKSPDLKEKVLELLNVADFGIDDIIEMEFEHEKRIEKLILSERKVHNREGEKSGSFRMPMDLSESEGTRKIFNYAGAILRALTNGFTLVVDEFDARLHPSLTKKIVEMFNSSLNKAGAQLVFTTHDTNLLDPDLLRRDQIYFAEKNSKFETCFYSLYDFKGIRNDASYEKDYIKGKYGAVPYLGNIEKVLA